MAKVLFLDDAKERLVRAAKVLAGHDVVYVETAQQAIDAIKEQEFNTLCLDHDLAEEHYAQAFQSEAVQAALPGTGMDVVRFLCSPDFPGPKPFVIVHSLNVTASHRMLDTLKDGGFSVRLKPFTTWR